jgi:hypothetical protein
LREPWCIRIRSSMAAALCPDGQQLSTQIHDTAEAQTLRDLLTAKPVFDRHDQVNIGSRQ